MMQSALEKARRQLEAEAWNRQQQYQPRGTALELQSLELPEVLLSGPAGTGKSRSCLEKVHHAALQYPGMRALFVRKTRVSLTESGLVTFEKHVLGENNPICTGIQRENRHVYRYPNGSEIVVGGIDRPGRVMSTEYDLIYVQEAIELDPVDWESLTTRLRNGVMPYQQLIADTNPAQPSHWLKKRCDSGSTRLLFSSHEDNPLLWDGTQWTDFGKAYIAKLDNLTGVRKQRLRHGIWAQAEGVVYDDWDERVHLINSFPIPPEWRRVRAVDFGFTNPYACGWGALDPDGRLYIYREIYRTQRIVEDHAAHMKRLSEGERIDWTVADHDAEDRATLERHGIRTTAAKKAISVGIQAVQQRLRPAGDGKPRLFVFRDSLVEADPFLEESKKPLCLRDEMGVYVWPKGSDGKALKEVPVDDNNHAEDWLRYMVMELDQGHSVGRGRKRNPIFGS